MGMTLYEISEALRTAIEGGYTVDEDTGVIVFAPDDLDMLSDMHMEKLEACGLFIKNLEAEENAILHEERRLNSRRKTLQAKRERLIDYVLADMVATETSVDTAKITMRPRRNPPAVEIDDLDMLPDGYRRIKVEADKSAIRRAIKSGAEVPGAHMGEGTWRLAIG